MYKLPLFTVILFLFTLSLLHTQLTSNTPHLPPLTPHTSGLGFPIPRSDLHWSRIARPEPSHDGSGYFWDHVLGVTRIPFAKQSNDGTETGTIRTDLFGNFFGFDSSVEEDRSKLAFSSDDQPVDDLVRNKLVVIEGIEDALLLKTSGVLSWFGRRLYRSNSDFLNPRNNPLLQDPDTAGITVITRSDKVLLDFSLRKLGKIHIV